MHSDDQFSLCWNDHHSSLVAIFENLLESGTLVDCTIAAEGQFLKAHKVVLSACSPYFQDSIKSVSPRNINSNASKFHNNQNLKNSKVSQSVTDCRNTFKVKNKIYSHRQSSHEGPHSSPIQDSVGSCNTASPSTSRQQLENRDHESHGDARSPMVFFPLPEEASKEEDVPFIKTEPGGDPCNIVEMEEEDDDDDDKAYGDVDNDDWDEHKDEDTGEEQSGQQGRDASWLQCEDDIQDFDCVYVKEESQQLMGTQSDIHRDAYSTPADGAAWESAAPARGGGSCLDDGPRAPPPAPSAAFTGAAQRSFAPGGGGTNRFEPPSSPAAATPPSVSSSAAKTGGVPKTFSCPECLAAFPTVTLLNKHVRARGHSFKCRECGYTAVSHFRLGRHARVHTAGDRWFKCDHCEFASALRANLAAHLRTHVRDASGGDEGGVAGESFCCPECLAAFSTAENLKEHVRALGHAWKCGECGYVATAYAFYAAHMRTHTGEKPFKCGHCRYASALRCNLVAHQRLHGVGAFPDELAAAAAAYDCPECAAAFPSARQLKQHMRASRHAWKCGECGYVAISHSYLVRHTRTHTGEKPFKCAHCDYAAAQRANLVRHNWIHAATNSGSGGVLATTTSSAVESRPYEETAAPSLPPPTFRAK